ncbi:MAG: prolipoprotein diacylglyceryl transferase [Deltaproteobacteria bacterium]|nr:prolipoprotein diacylglyceryl transferase [Deltaproteobacteria bacterium]
MTSVVLSAAGLPFFESGVLFKLPIFGGVPIQTFGVIVAAGVLIGAYLLRRYAEWHGVPDEHIRGITGWITVTGFIGAHVFDVLAYQWTELQADPLLIIKIWAGISSYGGFIGGAMGFAFYVWWKRLDARLMGDICIVGLLVAFSIGRIGCTVVSDHIGAAVGDPNAWYAVLAMDYPRFGEPVLHNSGIAALAQAYPGTGEYIRAWNLGFIELLYLIPVNALILFLAFRPSKRPPAGFLIVVTGLLYAPVRFFLEYLRPETSDPRYLGLTFAQWSSIVAFGAAAYVASRLLKNGKPAEPLTRTSGEMQQKLKTILKEETDASKVAASKEAKNVALPTATAKQIAKAREDAKAIAAENAAEKTDAEKDTAEKVDEVLEAKRRKEEQDEKEAAERRAKQDAEWNEKMAKKAEAEKAAKEAAAAKAEAEKAAKAAAGESAGDEEPLDHAAPAGISTEKSGGKKSGKKPKTK